MKDDAGETEFREKRVNKGRVDSRTSDTSEIDGLGHASGA